MFEEMKKDPAVKLQLASSFASLANYWKFYDGETKQLLKYEVYGTKKQQEEALQAWINTNKRSEYARIFSGFEQAYKAWEPYAKHKEYYEQGITGPMVMRFANMLEPVERLLVKGGGDPKKALEGLNNARATLLRSLNKPSEQQMLWQLVQQFNKGIAPDQQPVMFFNLMKQTFGPLNEDNTYKNWAAAAFANSMLLDDAKWNAFVANPDAGTLQNDPLYYTARAFRENWNKFRPQLDAFNNSIAELSHLYLKAYREANAKKVMYPDANSSMRLSYGQVKSYRPRDGVRYDLVTTAAGLLEKYKPGDYEFDLPANQIALLKKKDFGQYADPVRKDLVIGFITTDDITGGNSGSPVINGSGQLIGLAFDGNYEALSHKINFDKDLCRTICVDIRYVLWCIDKLGGAPHIVKELTLVK
jgi:hypothetical protein